MKVFTLALTGIGALALVGCGGSGSAPNTFAGSYSGTWSSSKGDSGTAMIVITDSGSFTGTTDDTTANQSGTMVGQISRSGSVSGTVTFTKTLIYTAVGTFSQSATGTLSGTLTSTVNGATQTDTYSLSKQQ